MVLKLIKVSIIFIRRQVLKLARAASTLCNYLILLLQGVQIEKARCMDGLLYVSNRGAITIGPGAYINSCRRANPTGFSTRTALVVGRNGRLAIGGGFSCSNSVIVCWESVEIGDNVFIGTDCKIYDTDFHSTVQEDRMSVPEKGIKTKAIYIGSHVFIGTGVIVLKGVTIGDSAVISAGSVVVRDVPEREIWGGNPARKIGVVNGSGMPAGV